MIFREENEGGRAMMRDDERVRPGGRTEIRLGYGDKHCRLSSGESLVCERENLIFDAFVDF